MTILEDKGLNEIYKTDIEINVELIEDIEYHYKKNTIYFIPVNSKTNLIETKYLSYKEFEYKNIESNNNNNNNNTVFVVIIIIIILFLVVVIAVFCYLRYKKRNKIEHMSQGNLLDGVESNA